MSRLDDLLCRVSEVARKEEKINLVMLENANLRIKKVESYLHNLGVKKKIGLHEKQGNKNDPYNDELEGLYKSLEWKKDKNKNWRLFYTETNVSLETDPYSEYRVVENTIKDVPLLEAASNTRISYSKDKLEKFLEKYIEETQHFISQNMHDEVKNDEF